MSQEIFIFNLPEERSESIAAKKGMDYFFCLHDMREWLMSQINNIKLDDAQIKILEKALDEFNDNLQYRNIFLDEIE